MAFYLIYYLLFIGSLTAIPYLVYRYVMSGDEYTLVSSTFYPIMWVAFMTFLACYFWISLQNIYVCFFQKKSKGFDIWRTFRTLHAIMVNAIYSSLYMTIFGLVGFIVGMTMLDNVQELRDLFLSISHIPYFEYFIKGIPLMAGAFVGQFLTSWCTSLQCP